MAVDPKRIGQKRGDLYLGERGIIKAAHHNDIDLAKRSLKFHPASINDTDERDGRTALHISVFGGNLTMVRLLLSQPGIDVTLKDYRGDDPLDIAIRVSHHPGITDELFRFRASQLGLDGLGGPTPSTP